MTWFFVDWSVVDDRHVPTCCVWRSCANDVTLRRSLCDVIRPNEKKSDFHGTRRRFRFHDMADRESTCSAFAPKPCEVLEKWVIRIFLTERVGSSEHLGSPFPHWHVFGFTPWIFLILESGRAVKQEWHKSRRNWNAFQTVGNFSQFQRFDWACTYM